jgi:hypothetical protein
MRLCNMILGPPSSRAQLVDRLLEAIGRLGAEQVTWREAGTELEALQSSTAQVRDLVLESADVPSSLVASLSSTVELLDGRIDTAAANRVF